jgi:hypothetical protein
MEMEMSEIRIPSDKDIAGLWGEYSTASDSTPGKWQIKEAILWGLKEYAEALRAKHELLDYRHQLSSSECAQCCAWNPDDWLREAARQKGIEL